jgi:predicted peroxiredoxin
MHVVYLTAAGTADPTRASVPMHLAVNGSVEVGQQVSVVLAGDAVELVTEGARSVTGVGVPPMAELLDKLAASDATVFV